jgi:hypothetical protein
MSKRRVWKFGVPLADEFSLALGRSAEVLHVGVQHERLFIWALVDPDQVETLEQGDRAFRMVGTGHEIVGDWHYIGTVQLAGGELILHLFEGRKL